MSVSNLLPSAKTTKDTILETGAAATQSFTPIRQICAHLNAFHVYASDPHRPAVEANHYCSHVHLESLDGSGKTNEIRQCLVYDAPEMKRLIGVEYLITPEMYGRLEEKERRLWHSHLFEVKSGLLILPNATLANTNPAWEAAETAEMQEIIGLYGKTYHFWQVDRGDELPLGEPQLMMSFTESEQVPWEQVNERDERFGVETKKKGEARKGIESPGVHVDADSCWKGKVE